jgi:hypothetical protein
MADLIQGLGDSKGKLGAARKALERLERRTAPVAAPLPGPIKQRQERKAGCVGIVRFCAMLVVLLLWRPWTVLLACGCNPGGL